MTATEHTRSKSPQIHNVHKTAASEDTNDEALVETGRRGVAYWTGRSVPSIGLQNYIR
jgi:hypothetical protein